MIVARPRREIWMDVLFDVTIGTIGAIVMIIIAASEILL